MTRQFTIVLTSADGQVNSRFECEAVTPQDALAAFAGAGPRTWLYGLTADEWLHLAGEGEGSEVAPCCANLSDIREMLNALAVLQSLDDTGMQLSAGRHLLSLLDADGDGHDLGDAAAFPLLARVLDGIRAQQASPPWPYTPRTGKGTGAP